MKRRFKITLILLVVFLVMFPKGGFKIGELPITWGYILLFILFLFSCFNLFLKKEGLFFLKSQIMSIILLIPIQLYMVISLLIYGFENTGFTVSLLTNLIFLPWLFLILLSKQLALIDLSYLFKLLKNAIFFTAAYGVFLFIYKFSTGKFIEIPFLTLNQSDVGELDNKFIDRGGLFKLISTYNNGNIYGASMLIMLPLYMYIEKRVIRQLFLYLALILTLSRTAWIGIIIYQVLSISLRKINIKSIFYTIIGILCFSILLAYIISYLDFSYNFLLDKNLGGRADQLDVINHISLFSSGAFTEIHEIVYLSFLGNFGIAGLILFLIGMMSPLLFYQLRMVKDDKKGYKQSLYQGLLMYLITAGSDGALLYIPVMVFFWFILSLLLSNNLYFTDKFRYNLSL